MALEIIPLSVFLAPSPFSLSLVDRGLTFFIGTGAVLLGLVIAEKLGFQVNNTVVRWTVRITVAIFVLWAVLTSGFLTHVMFGY
jgi:hypothetical protein